jgi:hypothetical protein
MHAETPHQKEILNLYLDFISLKSESAQLEFEAMIVPKKTKGKKKSAKK